MLRLGPFRTKIVARATGLPRSGVDCAPYSRAASAGECRAGAAACPVAARCPIESGIAARGDMSTDRFGLTVTTESPRALTLYVEAVDRILSADAGAEGLLAEAIGLDPDFALAQAALGRSAQLSGRFEEARRAAARAVACVEGRSERERRHVEALALAINGEATRAMAAVEAHRRDFPRDALVLSLALGVYGLIAFSGR